MARDFLIEIGTEELPASACGAVLRLLPERVAGLFAADDIDLETGSLRVMVSPRRIAVLITAVPEIQTPRENVQRGPAVEAAFGPDGAPTKAAEGFARAKGVAVGDLQVREENGRGYVFAVSRSEGRATADLLPDICVKIVRDMYFPKNMRWGSRELRFSRPMRSLAALFGDDIVPFEVAGVVSGRASCGHRWLGSAIGLSTPAAYVEALRSVRVMVDHEEREAFLRSELDRLAGERGLTWADPMGKMNEVLYLVEWPTVLEGSFGDEHLRLPADVLVTAMQSHQRYFPLIDPSGALACTFLYVSNGDPAFAPQITAGNERVLEGRIEDAEFSFDKDLASGLEHMAGELDRVVFHVKIGTMADKCDRLVTLVAALAAAVGAPEDSKTHALEAARLAKADQVSVMVREFADLEGVMGETYALIEGFPGEVAQAIREQYLPDAAGGVAPRTVAGALLATAEKVDNIVGAFACGEPPSGSKDPYGLRRAAMGMVTIAFLHGFEYDVRALVRTAYAQLERFPQIIGADQVVPDAVDFIKERLAKSLTDSGVARDAVEAVLPTSDGFADLRSRAVALESFRGSDGWDDLVVTFTRPSNLARKLPAEASGVAVDPDLFVEDAERGLHEAWVDVDARCVELTAAGDHLSALGVLASLRAPLDRFFDVVLVMAEDEAVRLNRLRLLEGIAASVGRVARLDRLQG
ncbi:MAG TPA: glycine--tRNA ligase subunit beta [Thermoleophilia bacterium]|nr:glycine--tRNA ligase subunit beta [Thermoleophilia bacterium]